MRIALTLSLLPLALLAAGCQSEAQILASARTDALNKCNADDRIKTNMVGMDASRFCTCLTDKMFTGRSAADIAKLAEPDQKAESTRLGMEWSAQCVGDQMRGGAPAAPAPAAAPPATPPAVPAPAQDAAADTIEEAADEVE